METIKRTIKQSPLLFSLFLVTVVLAVVFFTSMTKQTPTTTLEGSSQSVPQPYLAEVASGKEGEFQQAAQNLHLSPEKIYGDFPLLYRVYLAPSEVDNVASQLQGVINTIKPEDTLEVMGYNNWPNDPFFTSQWPIWRGGFTQAWSIAKDCNSVTIAVVDTGIKGTHSEFSDGRIKEGMNFVANPDAPIAAGANSDDHGHGTGVASIIGAIPNNKEGIAGVCWTANIMPLKACNEQGKCKEGDVIAAIRYATDYAKNQGKKMIINLSVGAYGEPSMAMTKAVYDAHDAGLVLIAAAGNKGPSMPPWLKPLGNRDAWAWTQQPPVMAYPAKIDPVIAINMLCPSRVIALVGTSYGPGLDGSFFGPGLYINLRAKSILTKYGVSSQQLPTFNPDDKTTYGYATGSSRLSVLSSYAAAAVTGEAALVWHKYPSFSNQDVEKSLLTGTQPPPYKERMGEEEYRLEYANGLLDPEKALRVAETIAKSK